MSRENIVLCLVLLATTSISRVGTTNAQLFRPRSQQQMHRVTILNKSGLWLKIKIVGYGERALYYEDLKNNESTEERLIEGDRVLICWNRQREIVLIAPVYIDSSGTLTIPSPKTHRPKSGEGLPARAGALQGYLPLWINDKDLDN